MTLAITLLIIHVVIGSILVLSGIVSENTAMAGHRRWPSLAEHSREMTASKIEQARALRKYAFIWPIGIFMLSTKGSQDATDFLMEVRAERARKAMESAERDLAASRRTTEKWK